MQGVTSNFFSTLGVSPLVGRDFAPDEGPEGRDSLVVLSYALWQRRFGGDAAIVGRTIQLNSRAFTVIGVMPQEVGLFLKAGSLTGKPADLWMPFAFTAAQRQPRGRYLSAIARLKPEVSLDQARTQMATIAASLTKEWPDFDTGWGVMVVPIHEELSGALPAGARRPLRGGRASCSSSRARTSPTCCSPAARCGSGRSRSAWRSARRAAASCGSCSPRASSSAWPGGALGLLVAQWSLDGMLALSPVDLTNLSRIHLSYGALGFTAGVSILTALLCGVVPAFEGARARRAGRPERRARGRRAAASGIAASGTRWSSLKSRSRSCCSWAPG